MLIQIIKGATRILGKSQGYLGLPVRDEVIDCSVNGRVPCMISAWEPTPEELALLNAGRPVYVRVLGTTPPPMYLYVEKDNAD